MPKQKKQRTGRVKKILLLALGIIVFFAILYLAFDNNRVVVHEETLTIGGLNKKLEGFTILHISNLHGKEFGTEQQNLINLINKQKFDVVAITGDMAGDNPQAAQLLAFALSERNVPVFFITGEDDPPPLNDTLGDSPFSDYIQRMQKHDAIYLDAPEKVMVGSNAVWFIPEHQISLDTETTRDNLLAQRENIQSGETAAIQLRNIDYQLDVLNRLDMAREQFEENDIFIALLHTPLSTDFLETMQEWSDKESNAFMRRLHLVLSGHYNGGQLHLGSYAPFVPADHLPLRGFMTRLDQISGLVEVNSLYQYTSPGLGNSPMYKFPIRFFNTPTITLIHLTAQMD